MNLILRFVWTLLTSAFRPGIAALDASDVAFRVLPNDLDLNMHMNNGRYLTIMDLGRLDLILRNGLFRAMRTSRWTPVLAAARVHYRRSLAPFERYVLRTRVLGWDDSSIYMEQCFLVGDSIYARGIVRAVFLSKAGRVPTQEVAGAIGYSGASPELDQRLVDSLRMREPA